VRVRAAGRPDTQLAINLDTLGWGEVTMSGDNAGLEVEAGETCHANPGPRLVLKF
jgi:hypothetical protein